MLISRRSRRTRALPAFRMSAMWTAIFSRSSPIVRSRRWARRRRRRRTFARFSNMKDVDAITIATPDHWHAPMAIAGLAGGQARLCGEAMQPQSRRGRDAGAGAAEVRQARADGHTAALFPTHHRDRRKDSRRHYRQAVLRESLVRQHQEVDRHRQRSARAAAA